MSAKTTSWVSYLTIIGWLIAYLAGDKEGAKIHLNQSLVIWLGFVVIAIAEKFLIYIPVIGGFTIFAAKIFLIVMWIIGLVAAINQEEKELFLIGQIKLLK